MHKAQLYRIIIGVVIVATFVLSVFAALSSLDEAPAPATNTNTNTININSPAVQTVANTLSLPDINRCSREALVALPGIGEVLADRIVAGRPYADIYALDRVDGIGPETIAGLNGKVVAE